MNENPPAPESEQSEEESLKKTTRISLEEALNVKPSSPKKTTSIMSDQFADKNVTGPIAGIPTHTGPIPQTIRLKRPSTSPIVINPPDITSAPTVVKTAHAKVPAAPSGDTATVIKKPLPPKPTGDTSRIMIDADAQLADIKQKTAPLPAISATEPTPGPKTIRLKRPSSIIDAAQLGRTMPIFLEELAEKKSETAKIELPPGAPFEVPTTQRKTIKIKRTDRNIIAPRSAAPQRPAESKAPELEKAVQKEEEADVPDKMAPVFSLVAGMAVVCLALLVYLLAAQSFGPDLALKVPAALF